MRAAMRIDSVHSRPDALARGPFVSSGPSVPTQPGRWFAPSPALTQVVEVPIYLPPSGIHFLVRHERIDPDTGTPSPRQKRTFTGTWLHVQHPSGGRTAHPRRVQQAHYGCHEQRRGTRSDCAGDQRDYPRNAAVDRYPAGDTFTLTALNVRLLPDGYLAVKAYGRPTSGGRGTYVLFPVPDTPELAALITDAAKRAGSLWAAHRGLR